MPDMIPQSAGPGRQTPVPDLQSPLVRAADLCADEAQLLCGETVAPDMADRFLEGDRGVVAVEVAVVVWVGGCGARVALASVGTP